MMTNIEGRMIRLETLLRWIQARIAEFANRLNALDAQMRQNSGIQYNWGGSGGSTSTYWCVTPSSGSWPGGAPPGGTPGSFTADVYKIVGGSYVLVASGATIYNGYPSSPGNGKTITVGPNGDGSYGLLGESCS